MSFLYTIPIDAESQAKSALAMVGATVDVQSYIIAIPLESGEAVQAFFTPKSAELIGLGVSDLLAIAEDAYLASEDAGVLVIDDVGGNENFHIGARNRHRMSELERRLNALRDDRTYFVGYPREVGPHLLFPVVSVLKILWDRLPALTTSRSESRVSTLRSIQDGVIQEVLSHASESLKDVSISRLSVRNNARDVVQRAVERFINNLVFVNGSWEAYDIFESMNALAAAPYEGRAGSGGLILSKDTNDLLEVNVRFDPVLELQSSRGLRKALEMTSSGLSLLTDGSKVFGLGAVAGEYDQSSESVFKFDVISRGEWQLGHGEMALIRVSNGKATLPRERIVRSNFVEAVDRLFDGAGDADTLWKLATASADQAHGTMLVVHKNAQDEVTRLGTQATPIQPALISGPTLTALSAIDGAILVDPSGVVHAAGVILDGSAVPGLGDPSRGARFNSGVRYSQGAGRGALVIIVSEDGMIDLLPDLKRRVAREEVERAVTEYETLAAKGSSDKDTRRALSHAESLAFYMDQAQCDRINSVREKLHEESKRENPGGLHLVSIPHLSPSPEMDESFFKPASDPQSAKT